MSEQPAEVDQTLSSFLNENEQLIWTERPDTLALFLHIGFWILLVSILVGAALFVAATVVLGVGNQFTSRTVRGMVFAVLAVVVMLDGGMSYLIARHLHNHVEYVVTDCRLIQLGQRNKQTIASIQWSDVKGVDIRTGWVGSICNTGTLRFIVTESDEQKESPVGFLFRHVSAPHQSLERIQSGKPSS